jgi:adenylate cyclase
MQARGELRRDAEGYWVAGETVNWSVLPAKVEGVIEQRIGRLDKDLQGVLAVASIEGESFTAEVVARVRGLEEFELVQRLSQELAGQHRLIQVESVGRAGQQRLSRYRFRHHLFQRYLYNRLTQSERAYLHEKVGGALESLFADETTTIAVQLAHHFEQAGLAEKTIMYLRQGGEQAQRIAANQETIRLLIRALALLAGLPPTPDNLEQELAIRIILGKALIAVKGIGSPESYETYRLAYELCQRVGNVDDLFAVLRGVFSTGRNVETNFPIAQQLLQLADEQPNPIYKVSAYHVMGRALVEKGEFRAALNHLEQSLALYEPSHHQDLLLLCGQDEGIAAMANLSVLLWYLGYPDQALQRAQQTVALAEKLAHHMSVAIAKHFVIRLHLLRGEVEIAHQKIDALLALGREQGFGFVVAVGTRYRGEALLLQDKLEAGIAQLEQARSVWRATGTAGTQPYMQLRLAQAYSRSGQFEHGLTLLSEAEAAIGKSSEFLTLMYQIKGEILLTEALDMIDSAASLDSARRIDEAEAAFMRSVLSARQQQAKSLELKATLGLCRLWQRQGKTAEARAILATIYDWFTEGFDTADLLDANALLEELTASLT